MENQDNTRKDLKIQALLEKVSALTTNYENQIADLRVELTLAEQSMNHMREQLKDTNGEEESQPPSDDA